MENKILFKPVTSVNQSTSINSFRSVKRFISPEKLSKRLDHQSQCRKNLPQTSNLLLKRVKSPQKLHLEEISSQESLNSATIQSEGIILINKAKDKLSKELFNLIVRIWSVLGTCPIFPDTPGSAGSIYEYLFDSNYNRVSTVDDLKSKPVFLIISTKSSILESFHNVLNTGKSAMQEVRSLKCINLYSSIIEKTQNPVQTNRKVYKSPVYKLKKVDSMSKYSKSPLPQPRQTVESSQEPQQHVFPCSKGRRVKEGAGGFRKPVLLFGRNKGSPLPISDTLTDNPALSHNKNNLKDYPDLEDLCLKYSITQTEFISILTDYTYLKDNHLIFPEHIQEAYQIKPEILQALNPEITEHGIKWEDFIKIHVVVLLKRGRFRDLFDFIINFLNLHRNKKDEILWVSKVFGKNYHLIEKIIKIKAAVQKSQEKFPGFGELMGFVEDIGMNIFDLRLMVTLIIRNY